MLGYIRVPSCFYYIICTKMTNEINVDKKEEQKIPALPSPKVFNACKSKLSWHVFPVQLASEYGRGTRTSVSFATSSRLLVPLSAGKDVDAAWVVAASAPS